MPGGRPSKLDAVIATRPDGTPVTVADRILETVRTGGYIETAAARAGIPKSILYTWLKNAARASQRLHAGETTPAQLTRNERRCIEFADALDAALADSETEELATHRRLALGGHEVVTVTVKVDEQGRELERSERRETLAPNARALEWRLERRFPDRWGRRQQGELSGPGGGAIEVEVGQAERARQLADALREFQGLPPGDQ